MKTLLLIDAYAMIYRAYYAFIRAPRMNSKGENTSAIYGFANTLEDLLRRIKPTHLAVAFDPHGKTLKRLRRIYAGLFLSSKDCFKPEISVP